MPHDANQTAQLRSGSVPVAVGSRIFWAGDVWELEGRNSEQYLTQYPKAPDTGKEKWTDGNGCTGAHKLVDRRIRLE